MPKTNRVLMFDLADKIGGKRGKRMRSDLTIKSDAELTAAAKKRVLKSMSRSNKVTNKNPASWGLSN